MYVSSIEIQDSLQLDFATNGILRTDNTGLVSSDQSIASGSFTPTYSSLSNITINSTDYGSYIRYGDVIQCSLSTNVTTGLISASFQIDLPVARTGNFSGSNQLSASCLVYNGLLTLVSNPPVITSVSGSQNVSVSFPSLPIGTYNIRLMLVYSR